MIEIAANLSVFETPSFAKAQNFCHKLSQNGNLKARSFSEVTIKRKRAKILRRIKEGGTCFRA
jgi:hypothetical protein